MIYLGLHLLLCVPVTFASQYSRPGSNTLNVVGDSSSASLMPLPLVTSTEAKTLSGFDEVDSLFNDIWRPVENRRQQLHEMMVMTFTALQDEGVTAILWNGSLLGAVRHHGLIPWDDDTDVIVNRPEMMKKAPQIAARLASADYILKRAKGGYKQWIVYPRDGEPTNSSTATSLGISFNWPYVDLLPFILDATTGMVVDCEGHILPKSVIFPLQHNPAITFEGLVLPVPQCTRRVLTLLYGDTCFDTCLPPPFDHRTRKRAQFTSHIRCEWLGSLQVGKNYFPASAFVDPDGCG